jgi:hypothetical protein
MGYVTNCRSKDMVNGDVNDHVKCPAYGLLLHHGECAKHAGNQ